MVEEVLGRLSQQYGPFSWKPRLEPVAELVTTILSQNTSDTNAARAFQGLIDRFGSLVEVTSARTEDIELSIKVGGLASQKAVYIKGALDRIIQYQGNLSLDFLRDFSLEEAKSWLTSIPGVGKKTAAVTLCFAFGMPAMAVDTHVYRVTKRLGVIKEKTTIDRAHDLLEQMVSPEKIYSLHVCLITHGRQTCKALRPLCSSCTLADICPIGKTQNIKSHTET
ncbi:MAG: endonuclease-3 [Chloroflexi bacterium]|nr:MAG: endonuclease-3 [Chloroflexota bacterium]